MSAAFPDLYARHCAALSERAPAAWQALQHASPALQAQARIVLVCSDFVARSLTTREDLLPELIADDSLNVQRDGPVYRALAAEVVDRHASDEAGFMRAMRRLRQREMVRIAWRDLAGLATTQQTLAETSAFAEAVIAETVRYASARLSIRHGAPLGDDAGLIVLGMGKLGGGELNFSSDIDLIFLFAQAGETSGPSPLSYEEFYTRQGRLLIRLLDAVTEDGFVFRVDMRLRPFGDSGPLATSFAALEDYLQVHGRDWERYAYVKARALTGKQCYALLREQVLRPFVYRRYLDFGVFDSLREMKALIAREVERREMANHVKLGPGGIREIEFIVQAFQLIRGGQDRDLRESSLLTVLPRLRGAKLLPVQAVDELLAAYLFLRRLENRLQMLDDQQTHRLPDDAQTLGRIALAMNEPDVPTLLAHLQLHRDHVTQHFGAVILAPGAQQIARGSELACLWDEGLDAQALQQVLTGMGVAEAQSVAQSLLDLRSSGRVRRLDEIGRRRLVALLGCLLHELPQSDPADALRRLLSIIEAIGQRSAYFALLLENSTARRRLIELCAQGRFLAERIAAHPLLLDELIDEQLLGQLPGRAALAAELATRAAQVADEDPDRQVEMLVGFQRAAIFRIAVADLVGHLPLMQVSDRLTEVAEVIVDEAMRMAWRQITATLGAPRCIDPGEGAARAVRVAAVGYGKLGGRELGYASDLDLVFLHDSAGEAQETDREPPVDNQVFFLRYAQRLMHILTVHSAAGRLYEVDVRLRPSGKGGMLVTSIDAFRNYQFQEAWTWEHQALLHARAVAGDTALQARFESLRVDVLQNAVRRVDLRDQVAGMRERMRRELSAAGPGEFDVKQDRGGMADIEFLAQYWALRWARDFPPVAWFSDTIRQLESVASAALVPQETVDQLVSAYQAYRLSGHRRALEGLSNRVPAAQFAAQRAQVTAIWEATMRGAEAL